MREISVNKKGNTLEKKKLKSDIRHQFSLIKM